MTEQKKEGPNSYEAELAESAHAVLREADSLYEGRGRLQKTFERLSARLDSAGMAYCLIGGYALILHGVRRFTEDIDVLLREADLIALRDELIGSGYVGVPGSERSIRDAETGVRIDFVVTGQYPGDGEPKPITFPDPEEHLESGGEIRVVDLKTLIELKLASGMTAPKRIQDLADVQRLAEVHQLDAAFADELHPYVREEFLKLV